jgi:hypothetical protein
MDLKRSWLDVIKGVFSIRERERQVARDAYDALFSGDLPDDPAQVSEIIRRAGRTEEQFEAEFRGRLNLVELREAVSAESKLYDEERQQLKQDNDELKRWWNEQCAEWERRATAIESRTQKNASRHTAIVARKQQIEKLLGPAALESYFQAKHERAAATNQARGNRQRAKANIDLAGQHDNKAAELSRSQIRAERENGERQKAEADRLRAEAEQWNREADEADERARANDPAAVRERLYEMA